MKVTPVAELPGLIVFEPKVFGDDRGFFLETFHAPRYAEYGVVGPLIQDNWSRSVKGTLRGLHFQDPNPQGKLVQVMRGAVWDVAVDVRKGSPHYGRWYGAELSEENKRQMWLPAGFAHGFYVLTDIADFVYKCTDLYVPSAERSVRYDDPDIGIRWPLEGPPKLSAKDLKAPWLKDLSATP